MFTEFYTIDPGLRASGLARWVDGELESVRLIRVPTKTVDLNGRIAEQAHLIADEVASFPVVSERMVHIPRRGRALRVKGYVDPNDLINLSLLSGRLGHYYVLASEWKGAVPREVEQDRSRLALKPCELALVERVLPASLRKEAWSAVGIGLSILGRAHSKCGWSFIK